MKSTVTRFTLFLALLVGVVSPTFADEPVTFDPPVSKAGIGCRTAEDVPKFIAFLKTLPGDMPTMAALALGQSQGINCSAGQAVVSKEEVVGHFDWLDGSKMVVLHLTFAGGGDIYTWREDATAKKTSCGKGCA